MVKLIVWMNAVLFLQAPQPVAIEQPEAFSPLDKMLMAGKIDDARAYAKKRIAEKASRNTGRFEAAIVEFVAAFEQLAQDGYAYGMRIHTDTQMLAMAGVIVPQLPVPENKDAKPIRYEDSRRIAERFATALGNAEEYLAAMDGPPEKVRLHAALIAIDINKDGTSSRDERLTALLNGMLFRSRVQVAPEELPAFELALDYADAAWLRAYCNLLMGASNVMLAYDYRKLFDATAQLVFLKPADGFASRSREFAPGDDYQGILDLIAVVHLLSFDLAEKERLPRAYEHFLTTFRESKLMWQRAQQETDDDHEWIPAPKQSSPFAAIEVNEEQLNSWLAWTDEAEAVLTGKKLIRFWRGKKNVGVNLRRVFQEPQPFDLILWVQGSAALPYLEKGEFASWGNWWQMSRLFNGRLWGFAVWVN